MKTVHFHIGPHKTGSTAIQKVIRARGHLLESEYGLCAINESDVVNRITRSLINGENQSATADLVQLAEICRLKPGDCLISGEDFSGELPGRSMKRKPYPKLFENLNTIRKAFSKFHCKFYFFIREPEAWLHSAYAQILKHSTRYASFEEFTAFLHTGELWENTLHKPRAKLQSDFIEIPYEEGTDFSSVDTLLNVILGPDKKLGIPHDSRRPNSSPSEAVRMLFEAVNRSGASSEAQRSAKKWLQSGEISTTTDVNELSFPVWPARVQKPAWLSPELEALWRRTEHRVDRQDQPNLLPDPFCNLSEFRLRPVEAPEEFPNSGRAEMKNQIDILMYRFRGLPETCLLLGLCISYLRRNTDHTEHAAFLFQRLWEEEYAVLLGTLPTRWLISAFQTFLDHGANNAQRLIGSSGYFLSNILKAYEAERALDGLAPDAIYPSVIPTTKNGFSGMDRFKLGGTDLLLDTNALLLELAVQDERAGRVAQEFMLRTKKSSSVFSRMDRSRIDHKIDIPQFSNCWSFFEDPRSTSSKE